MLLAMLFALSLLGLNVNKCTLLTFSTYATSTALQCVHSTVCPSLPQTQKVLRLPSIDLPLKSAVNDFNFYHSINQNYLFILASDPQQSPNSNS
jgi:hypothetical protein